MTLAATFTLLDPLWLVLLLPLAASLWLWRQPSRMLTIMRGLVYLLVLLAMAQPVIRRPSQAGTVVVLADRSLSMPTNTDATQAQWIRVLNEARGSDDRLQAIAFGRSPIVEEVEADFNTFQSQVSRDASDYAAALERALAQIGRDTPGRIIIFGDGRWTGRDPAAVAATAAARGVAIDYRLLERPTTSDVAISRIDAPATVSPGESFMITAWVRMPIAEPVEYELRRGNTIIARGSQDLPSGLSRLTFRDQAAQAGVASYRLTVRGSGEDPLPENNIARKLIGIDGLKPILHVTDSPNPTLAGLLRGGQLDVAVVHPDRPNWTLEELAGYSAVLLENVPAQTIGDTGMENLAAWVRQTGSGLMMTGGRTSFGPGGYYKSPLEPIMPVTMELRREHRKLALAIVIVMDRSGSMQMPASGGKTKMDLANLAAAEVVGLLTGNDEVGVIAVDSSPHTIVERQKVDSPGPIRDKILRIDSMGGGIFVYEGLSAGLRMLNNSTLGTRHIILFSDAQDSEQPGAYKTLIESARKAGITISVIGLGKDTDVDAPLLRDIAKLGDGRAFFTENATELPRLFAQDTFVVARSTFIDEPTAINITAGILPVTGQNYELDRPIGGYNLTYLRPEANQGAVSVSDEYRAPIVANWHVGSGRVLAYTGEADGQFTGPIAGWPRVGDFFTSLARWTVGEDADLPDGAVVDQQVSGSTATVTLYLDPRREREPFQSLPEVAIVRGTPGEGAPTQSRAPMQWTGADQLSFNLELRGEETAISTVNVGEATVELPPVSLMYSPEFAPVEPGTGAATLDRLARATGGQPRQILTDVWQDLPKRPRYNDLAHWLLLAAVVLLVLEVFERRSGMLSASAATRRRRAIEEARNRRADQQADQPTGKPIKPRKPKPKTAAAKAESKPEQPRAAKPEPEKSDDKPAGSIQDAFAAARQRARGRTGKKK